MRDSSRLAMGSADSSSESSESDSFRRLARFPRSFFSALLNGCADSSSANWMNAFIWRESDRFGLYGRSYLSNDCVDNFLSYTLQPVGCVRQQVLKRGLVARRLFAVIIKLFTKRLQLVVDAIYIVYLHTELFPLV